MGFSSEVRGYIAVSLKCSIILEKLNIWHLYSLRVDAIYLSVKDVY